MAFKASPSSQHHHCTDEAQKAETVLSAVIYILYIYIIFSCSSRLQMVLIALFATALFRMAKNLYIYIYIYIYIVFTKSVDSNLRAF